MLTAAVRGQVRTKGVSPQMKGDAMYQLTHGPPEERIIGPPVMIDEDDGEQQRLIAEVDGMITIDGLSSAIGLGIGALVQAFIPEQQDGSDDLSDDEEAVGGPYNVIEHGENLVLSAFNRKSSASIDAMASGQNGERNAAGGPCSVIEPGHGSVLSTANGEVSVSASTAVGGPHAVILPGNRITCV